MEIAAYSVVALLIGLLISKSVLGISIHSGPSNEPTIYEGDITLQNKLIYKLRKPKPGEMLSFNDPQENHRLNKRVAKVWEVQGGTKLWMLGDNQSNSRDSNEFGWVDVSRVNSRTEIVLFSYKKWNRILKRVY